MKSGGGIQVKKEESVPKEIKVYDNSTDGSKPPTTNQMKVD
jgi:hypothetical protein